MSSGQFQDLCDTCRNDCFLGIKPIHDPDIFTYSESKPQGYFEYKKYTIWQKSYNHLITSWKHVKQNVSQGETKHKPGRFFFAKVTDFKYTLVPSNFYTSWKLTPWAFRICQLFFVLFKKKNVFNQNLTHFMQTMLFQWSRWCNIIKNI